MFYVLGRTVEVCHTHQCLLANCSTTEHQQWRRLGRQRLHTATGGRPADWSVMTADVAWTACQTTVGGLQSDKMVPCRSVTDTRPSPACTEHTRGALNQWKLASVSVMWYERHRPAMERAAALSTDCRRLCRYPGKPTSTALP